MQNKMFGKKKKSVPVAPPVGDDEIEDIEEDEEEIDEVEEEDEEYEDAYKKVKPKPKLKSSNAKYKDEEITEEKLLEILKAHDQAIKRILYHLRL